MSLSPASCDYQFLALTGRPYIMPMPRCAAHRGWHAWNAKQRVVQPRRISECSIWQDPRSGHPTSEKHLMDAKPFYSSADGDVGLSNGVQLIRVWQFQYQTIPRGQSSVIVPGGDESILYAHLIILGYAGATWNILQIPVNSSMKRGSLNTSPILSSRAF